MKQLIEDSKLAKLKEPWKSIHITNLNQLRHAAMLRYKNGGRGYLTVMANNYSVPYLSLSHTLNGRMALSYILVAIQKDFGLSDAQVLACWPILRKWPRPDLEERAMRRAG